MSTLRIILGDQLTPDISSLQGIDPASDAVLMMEVAEEGSYVPNHKQKIVLILSAMRHFAEELRQRGISVDYVKLDDPSNTGNFTGEVARALKRHRVQQIVITEAGEWRIQEMIDSWSERFKIPVFVRSDDRFFADRARFAKWADGRRSWRMEFFYREMRREHGLLMDGDEPAGGSSNYDSENRKRLPANLTPPPRRRFSPDAITRDVISLVEKRFPKHVGSLDAFGWPVNRQQALQALDDFLLQALPMFGDYQDSMKADEAFLFHSLLSPALNIGLLTAREVCVAAEKEWRSKRAPLNAVEGFIRQILGWREYIRGVYWHLMPAYADSNALNASRALPSFYWSGETDMLCMREAIGSTLRHAYSHHIQRLMVTGNFALLAGIAPREIDQWYLAVYADAFEWVEMPNTLGMAIFADGGKLASKPYAASGAYIDRMSDYCKQCAYDVKRKNGEGACPFNRLYWAFLIRNEKQLSKNPRLAMPYKNLASWKKQRRDEALADAESYLASLRSEAPDWD